MNIEATINFIDLDLNNNGTFYTDSNGLGIIKRDLRNVTSTDFSEPFAPANFYPINTAIFIEDKYHKN